MLRKTNLSAALCLLLGSITVPVSAVDWPSLGYFGNYQPYGLQSRSSVATPPYFSLHPPVYYGGRHARPYGISPFATYPQVTAPDTYKARLGSDFVNPPRANPYCDACPQGSSVTTASKTIRKNGLVRVNPFVKQDDISLAGTDI